MRIRFTPGPESRIPLLHEIPNFSRTRIEGRNGIGKTLAVKLLQLATGDQPYRGEPSLWSALRLALGTATIEVTELSGANTVTWHFDSRCWPNSPESSPMEEWNGFDVLVDGTPSSVQVARELIAILRLDGSETVRDTMVSRVRDAAGQLRKRADDLRPISEAYDSPLEVLQSLTNGIHRSELDVLANDLRALTGEVKSLRDSLQAKQQRLHEVEEARSLVEILNSGSLSAAIAHRTAIDEELGRLQAAVEKLQTQAADLASQSAGGLRDDIRRHEQTVKRTTTRLENLRKEVEGLAEELGVDPESARVLLEIQSASTNKKQLIGKRRTLGKLPVAFQIGRDIEGAIRNRAPNGLDVPVAVIFEKDISVDVLRQGITYFRERSSRETPLDPFTLDEQIRITDQRIKLLYQLQNLLREMPRVRSNLADARSRLEAAAKKMEEADERAALGANLAEQRKFSDRIGELNEQRGFISAQIARLQRRGSEGEMRARLEILLRSVGASSDELDNLVNEVEAAINTDTAQLTDREDRRNRVEQALAGLRSRITAALQELAGPKYEWARSLLDTFALKPGADLAIAAEGLARLHTAAKRVDKSLDIVRGFIDGAPQAVSRLAKAIDHGSFTTDFAGISEPLRKAAVEYFEDTFASELGQDRIAEELFEGSGDLGFDLERMEVSWDGLDGNSRVRPLEAFSSGERAWTYTLARLHTPVRAARNRLLVLDEFGAYIEADKLAALERTLKTEFLAR